ncbi:hypothetical protein [uncultured Helicobacter sp.]|uniref:hypothetical protein n=1 Tax=Helicobacter sp. TaxID=218 RepID=UPI00374F20BE
MKSSFLGTLGYIGLLCIGLCLQSCISQNSALESSTQVSHTDSQKPNTNSHNSQTSHNVAQKNDTKSPKIKKDVQSTPPKPTPHTQDSQAQNAISTQDSATTIQEQKPKDSQGLKFDYKDLVAQPSDGESVDYNYTGIVRLYHNNGTLAWEISFKDGKQDGWTKWYYDNGQVRTQMFFVNGDANGESLWYYRHGALRERGNYANDLANGESKLYTPSGVLEYTIIYRDGREISRTTHNIKGKI